MVEITVRGAHELEAAPERATVHLQVHLDGPDAQPVYDGVADVSGAVRQTIEPLHDGGAITRWSVDQVRTWTERPWSQDGDQRPLVHHARVDVLAEFADIAQVSSWLTRVLLLRGVTVTGIEWSLTPDHRRRLAAEARTAAVTDAREKAQAYADALGLGEVRAVALADAGMLGESGATAPMGMAMMARKATMGGGDVELAPQPIHVSVEVDARFLAG
jgi:uncharacterized protein YggE